MPIDTAATIRGLTELAIRVTDATEAICRDAADIFRVELATKAPVGREGNSTNAPGALGRSMEVEGPVGGDGVYTARVGPTVVSDRPSAGSHELNYGRIRDIGGDIVPHVAPALRFQIDGQWSTVQSVHQEGHFYVLAARLAGQSKVDQAVTARLTVAVEGG